MTGPEREEEFEQFLKQRTMLPHRLAEAERFEPPAEVDRIILARAREAIHTAAPAPVYKSTRWALPFGLAATVIIAFAVLLHMRGPVGEDIPTAARSVPVRIDRDTAPASPVELRARAPQSNSAPVYPTAQFQTRRAEDATAESAAPERKAFSSRGVATDSIAQLQARESESPVAASAPAANEPESKKLAADEQIARVEAARAESDQPTPPDSTVQTTAARPPQALNQVTAKHRPAQQWLEMIERLRAEGKFSEAAREQTAFDKAYPNYRDAETPRQRR